ncbi:MAG: beta-propeller fold lactonase family protein [Nitrospira sp.]|nr:beta-propeller fold lactonase family protein [Nitrospira sp.]
MKRRRPSWFALSICVLLAGSGCGEDGGGGGGFGAIGGVGTTSIVYVANRGSDDVSGYSINPSAGTLVAIAGSPFPQIADPSAIAVSSNGFFAFVTNAGASNTVTAFRVATDGRLLRVPSTQATPNPAPVGMDPVALAISPNNQFLYVANRGSDTVTAFSIEDAGALTLVPQTGASANPISVQGDAPAGMAISSNGQFLYVSSSTSNVITVFQIGASGLLTLVPATGANQNPTSVGGTAPKSIRISPNGSFLYVANSGSNTVTAFQIGTNGLLTQVPPTAGNLNPISVGGTAPNGIIVSPNGQFLYTANGGGNVTTFTIGSGGLLTLVPPSSGNLNPVPAGTNPVAATLSPDGQVLFVANGGGRVSSYTITTTTGLLVPVNPLLGNPFPTGTGPSSIATPGRP